MEIEFRVRAKTAPDYRVVAVRQEKEFVEVSCDCDGFSGDICSHIDATLCAGERAMVHPEDVDAADRAQKIAVSAGLEPPPYWRAAWRKNLRWRGLSSRKIRSSRHGAEGQQVVCFTGAMPVSRKEAIETARAHGWDAAKKAIKCMNLVVAADLQENTLKLKVARENGIPIVTYEEWMEMLGNAEEAS